MVIIHHRFHSGIPVSSWMPHQLVAVFLLVKGYELTRFRGYDITIANRGHQAVSREVIQTLIEKTAKVLPKEIKWRVQYAFFVRSGFTPEALTLAQEHRAHLITLDQIESDMQQWLKLQQDR